MLQNPEINTPGRNNGENCKNLSIFNANLGEKKIMI